MKLAKQREKQRWDIMRSSALCACDCKQYTVFGSITCQVLKARDWPQYAFLKAELSQNVIININKV